MLTVKNGTAADRDRGEEDTMRPWILIWSGEGDGPGASEVYGGALTMRALRSRLTRERCGGQRWARAVWSDGSPVDMSGTDEDLAARVVE
jgi:hypothetical protein